MVVIIWENIFITLGIIVIIILGIIWLLRLINRK